MANSYSSSVTASQVESAFEFARICRKLDCHSFVLSVKASNPVIKHIRLLVAEMYVQGWDYPLQLGVTEAGEGEDGRMKSAIGIGTLLQIEQLQMRLQQEKSVWMLLERALGRTSSTLSLGIGIP